MKRISKLVVLMMVIAITLTLFSSVPVFALTDGDWEFQLLDNEVTITSYLGEGGNVVIPDTIYGCPVTKVEFKGWNNNFSQATSLTFPKTVKVVGGKYGFFGSIGGSDKLENLILPEGIETISESSFAHCEKLTEVIFPSTLKRIEKRAFSGCGSLQKVQFQSSLEFLGTFSFAECGLTEVTVPYVANCSTYVFHKNTNLKKAVLSEGYQAVPKAMFFECANLEEVVIPSTVVNIEDSAFMDCVRLKNVILPTGLKSVGKGAFDDCDGLIEVVLPYGVQSIGSAAFQNCDKLKSIYIPDTVTSFTGSNFLYGSDGCIVYCTAGSYTAAHCKKESISHLTDNSVNSGITVLYNGTRISFHSYGQNPELLNSRTLVPLRSIFEAMGAEVEWDGATSTAIAKRDGVEIRIQIGANAMYKDGKAIPVDVPAQLLNSRTMVPVRVIAEAFGADVQWNGIGSTVLINE